MKFDEILIDIGEFGPYQKRVYILVCLTAVFSAIQTMLPVFGMAIPDHRCKLPWLQNDTYDIRNDIQRDLVNLTVPMQVKSGKEVYSQCELYDVGNLTEGKLGNVKNPTEKQCDSWVYDKNLFESTTVTEFQMVCGSEIFRSHLNMIFFGGNFIGSICLGIVADIIGRKITLIISTLLMLGSGLGLAFASNFISYALFRIIVGFSNAGVYMIAFVLVIELVGPSKRILVGIVINFFWCIGLFALAGVAYILRQWRYLQLALTLPSVLFLSYFWLLPESPRWLLSKGRLKDAEDILIKIAYSNKSDLPKDLKKITFDESITYKFGHLFKSSFVVFRILILLFNWLTLDILYFGLSFNIGNLGGNIYLNFTLASITEAAAYAACLVLLHLTGRKVIYCSAMLLGGVACLGSIFPAVYRDQSYEWMTVFMALVGRMGSSAAFAVMFVMTTEMFPTGLRQSCIGCCNFFEAVGGMIAPYIADMGILVGGHLANALPLIVIGSVTVAAGLLSLILPETRNTTLSETVEDAVIFGREVRMQANSTSETSPILETKVQYSERHFE